MSHEPVSHDRVSHEPARPAPPIPLKIVVGGGFGVGKTTLIRAVSEITPLTTEAELTCASAGTDSLAGIENKSTTTVATDFGRITFDEPLPLVLYVFGTPGQERFLFTWDELTLGAVGAVVLADTRRLDASFAPIDYFEQRALPFVVAINEFEGAHRYATRLIRDALNLPDHVPVIACDARAPASAAAVLIALVRHVLNRTRPEPTPPQGAHR